MTVLAGVFILRFLDKTATSTGGYLVYLLMDDVTGVVERSRVRIAGISVGYVEDIRLEQGLGRVDLRIQDDVPLFEDAAAGRETRNLLGEYFIAISPGTRGKKRLEDGAQIRTVLESSNPDEVLQSVARITATTERITEALASTVGSEEAQENMRETLENLAQVTAALEQTVDENRQSVRNILAGVEAVTSSARGDAVAILRDVRAITAELRTVMTGAREGDQGAAQKVSELVERVDKATGSLEKTLANLESTTATIEKGEGTIGRLVKDDQLIQDIENVTGGISEYVSSLAQLRTILSLRTDFQFRTQTVKAFMEMRLQPREDKYYSIEIVNDPRGLTRLEQTNVATTNPNEPNQYQEIRSVTTNALRFSLQFAQRFGPVVGRFGLKESTGGVGLDLLLADDAFELRQDLFGFGEVVRPRWRLSLGYSFLDRLWLLAGVDDAISPDRREYFLGAQLRFDDNDLKAVLPFAPAAPQ